MLMAQGWEYKREHLDVAALALRDQGWRRSAERRSPDGRIWFYIRERDYDRVQANLDSGHGSRGGGDDDRHEVDTVMILGSAWRGTSTSRSPRRGTSRRWGIPNGTRLIRRSPGPCRRSWGRETGRTAEPGERACRSIPRCDGRRLRRHRRHLMERADGDPSVSANIPGLPGHNWSERDRDGDADRPQGRVAGAKVQAMNSSTCCCAGIGARGLGYFRNSRPPNGVQSFLGPTTDRRCGSTARGWRTSGRRCASTTTMRRSTRRTWSSWGSTTRRCAAESAAVGRGRRRPRPSTGSPRS